MSHMTHKSHVKLISFINFNATMLKMVHCPEVEETAFIDQRAVLSPLVKRDFGRVFSGSVTFSCNGIATLKMCRSKPSSCVSMKREE